MKNRAWTEIKTIWKTVSIIFFYFHMATLQFCAASWIKYKICFFFLLKPLMMLIKIVAIITMVTTHLWILIWNSLSQSGLDAGYRKLGAGALGWPRGMVWGGMWEGGSGWRTRVHPWRMHVDVWQNQYNIVK